MSLIPLNLDRLIPVDRRKAEEEIYMWQLRKDFAHKMDSPLLKSADKIRELYGD
jgi:hypothetical protein